MRAFKIILYCIVIALALAVLAFSLSVLWHALPKRQKEPEILSTEKLFAEVTEEEEYRVEPVPEEPAEEDPPAEAQQTEEAAQDESTVLEEPEAKTGFVEMARAWLETMTPEEKLWQLFITTPEALTNVTLATRAGEATKAALEERPVGGICYFAENLENQGQTAEMLANTQSYSGTGLFLCIDEEGGRVSRAGSNADMGVTHFDAPAAYGARGDVSEVFYAGKTMAQQLRALGFNLNFAPVADLSAPSDSEEIGDRSYSSDPAVAAPMAAAMADGLQRGGMAACLKHFPGHGSAEGDSHAGQSISGRTIEEMRQSDWLPFQSGIGKGAVCVMLSHLVNPELGNVPADLSPQTVEYLRKELNFAGIIVTDSHSMKAITDHYSSGEAAVLALQAGVDMILMPADLQAAFDSVKEAVDQGTLGWERLEESLLRILTVKYAFGIMKS